MALELSSLRLIRGKIRFDRVGVVGSWIGLPGKLVSSGCGFRVNLREAKPRLQIRQVPGFLLRTD